MSPVPDPWPPTELGDVDPGGAGSPDLSSAFGTAAAGSLRGLLAPRRSAVRAVDPVRDPDDADTGDAGIRDADTDLTETADVGDPAPRDGGGPQEEDTVAPPSPRPTRRAERPARAGTSAREAPREAPAPARRRAPAAKVRDRKDVDLLLLAVAREGVSGGQEFIELVRERSAGAFELTERSVYHQLHRLRNERLIRDTGRGGARRFVLTSLGERVLSTRVRSWEAFSRGVDRVLSADPAPDGDTRGR